MKHTLKRSLALLLVLLFAIPTFAFAEDLDLDVVSVEDVALVEDVVADDVVVEQEETEVKEEILDLGEEVKDEEIAEDNEAIAEANDTFNVVMDSDGGSTGITAQNVNSGSLVQEPEKPTKFGYTLDGWYNGETKWNFSTMTVEGAMTLKAKWIPAEITVKFDTAGGSKVSDVVSAYGATPAKPSDPTLAGQLFAGWFVGKKDGDNIVAGDTEFHFAKTESAEKDTIKEGTFVEFGESGSYTVPSEVTLFAKYATEYTVNFWGKAKNDLADNDIPAATQRIQSGKKATKPANTLVTPDEGYEFQKWVNDSGEEFNFDTEINATNYPNIVKIDLYPVFVPIQYTLTFENVTLAELSPSGKVTERTAADNTKFLAMTVDYGKKATEIVANRANYLFQGWYSDSSLTTKFNFDNVVTADATLYPSFVRGYNVEYYLVNKENALIGKDKKLYDATIEEDTETKTKEPYAVVLTQEKTNATKPVDPTFPDGQFKGWYSDAAGTNAYTFSTPITGAGTKVYGVFTFNDATKTKNVTIYYKKNNANGEAVDTSEVQEIVVNKTATAPAAATAKMTDYTFKGWYLVSKMEGGNPVASPTEFNFSTAITEDISIMAVYDAVTHTVTFNSNGGSSAAAQSIVHGQTATKPTVTRANYDAAQTKWYTDAKLTNEFNFTTPITEDITLYAKWVGIPIKIGFYKTASDANPTQTITSEYGAALIAEDVATVDGWTKTDGAFAPAAGKTFVGWFKGGVQVNLNKDVFTPTADELKETINIKLVAVYSDTMYTVTFDTDGGSEVKPQTIKEGLTATRPTPDPTKEGMSLTGWYTRKVGTDADLFNFNTQIKEDKTLYARWELATYKVMFEGDWDTWTPATVDEADEEGMHKDADNKYYYTLESGKRVEAPVDPSKSGNVFVGWFTDVDRTKAFDFSAPLTQNYTLYAKFAEAYNVHFLYEAGTQTGEVTTLGTNGVVPVKRGETLTAPTKAEANMNGLEFLGWYAADDNHKATDTAFDFSKAINAETWVVGKYRKATTYAIKFVPDNGSDPESTQYVVDGDLIVAPAVSWTGHTLEGWYDEDAHATTPYNMSVAPTAAMNLTAHWVAEKYTVTIETNGGSAVEPIKVDAGRSIYKYQIKSTKAGNDFVIYKDAAFTSRYNSEAIYENTTLYLKWEAQKFEVAFFDGETGEKLAQLSKYETVDYNATVTMPSDDDMKKALNDETAGRGDIKGVAGWYTDSQLRYAYDFTAPVTQNVKLYAKLLDAVTIDLKVASKDYDGKPIAPEVRVTCVVSADPVPAYKVEYKVKGADDSTYTETAPSTFGTYIVRVSVAAAEKTAAATKTQEVSINKIDVTLEWPTVTALMFNGNEQAPVPTVKGALEGETVEVIITGKQSKVGTGYKAVASLPADSNYKLSATAVTECEFSIVENTTAPEVTVNTDAAGVPTSLTVKNADGTTSEVPLTGNDIFTVESKVNEDGTTTMTISAKPGSGYNFAPIVTTVAAPVIPEAKSLKVTPGKKRATITWEAAKDIEGYEIEYGLKKKVVKTKTVKDPAAAKLTIKKLKKGKRYYFRIRTYKTVNGTKLFSKWSAWKRSKKIK